MTANRSCPYKKQATLGRLLATFLSFLLLALLVIPPIVLGQSADEKAALAEAKRLNEEAVKLYRAGKYAEAEPLLRRSLGIREKVLGPEHPDVALSLNNLAALYDAQGQYAQAEPLYRRSLAIREKALGPEHPDVSESLNNLATLYHKQGRYAEIEALLRRALGIREKALGPEHPSVAASLNGLAYLLSRDRPTLARSLYERARRIYLAIAHADPELEEAPPELFKALQVRGSLQRYVELLATMARDKISEGSRSDLAHAFLVAEQARGGLAQAALAKSSARVASGDPATAEIAREVQDLRNQRDVLGKQLTEEYGKPTVRRNKERLQNLQQQTQRLDNELAGAVSRLNAAFPKYAEVASPEPMDVEAATRMLRPDEALVSLFTLDDRVLVWLVRSEKDAVSKDIEIKKADLAKLVTRVRASLDQSANPNLAVGELLPFDVAGSHELFKLLVAPLGINSPV